MATLEALIRQRLMTNPRIEERLAVYGEEPAVFLQEARTIRRKIGEKRSFRESPSSWTPFPMQSGA